MEHTHTHTDTHMQYVVVAMNKKDDPINIAQHIVVSEFLDVFPKELPRLTPKRELEFNIELKLGTYNISTAPYYTTT
jgi:hypothetical protein